jgi:hypothetical protein
MMTTSRLPSATVGVVTISKTIAESANARLALFAQLMWEA